MNVIQQQQMNELKFTPIVCPQIQNSIDNYKHMG